MCVLSIGGNTVGPKELKFGMEDHIYPWEVRRYISFRYLYPQGRGSPKSGFGGPGSSNGAFLGKFHKTKIEGHPCKW